MNNPNKTYTTSSFTEQEEAVESQIDVLASFLDKQGLEYHIMVRVPGETAIMVATNTDVEDKEARGLWLSSLVHAQQHDETQES